MPMFAGGLRTSELFNWASLISRVPSNYTVSRSVSVRQPSPHLRTPFRAAPRRSCFHSGSFRGS